MLFSALMPAGAIEVAFRLLSHAARKIFCERERRHRLCFPAVSHPEKVCSKNYTYSLHLPFLVFGVRLKRGKKAFRIASIKSGPCLPVDLVYFPHSTLFSVVRSFMCYCLEYPLVGVFDGLFIYPGGLFWECNSGSVSCKPFFLLHNILVFIWCLITALDTLGLL